MRLTWIFAVMVLQMGAARAEQEGISAQQIRQSSYPERFKRAALRPFLLKEKDGAAKVSRTDDSRLSGILVSSQRGKRGVEKVRGTALIRRDESGILTQTLRGLMTRAQTFDSAGKSREVRRSVTPVVGGHFVEQVQYLFREAVKPGAGAFLLRLRANKHFFVDPRGKRLGELQPHEAEALRLNDR